MSAPAPMQSRPQTTPVPQQQSAPQPVSQPMPDPNIDDEIPF
jgi:single-strand DNA-binding protein